VSAFEKSDKNSVEDVVAAGWQPCRADQGRRPESHRIVVEMVDYSVDEFLWKNVKGHHNFKRRTIDGQVQLMCLSRAFQMANENAQLELAVNLSQASCP